jgi:hypothetical protein
LTEFDKVIPPGGVGKVTASLETPHYRGPVSKSVAVRAGGSSVLLLLKADVVSPIEVQPSETAVLRTVVGQPKTTELTVASIDGNPFEVLRVNADPRLVVKVGPPSDAGAPAPGGKTAARSRYLLTISSKPDAPVGSSDVNLTLTTNLPKAAQVPIRVALTVTGRVRVTPTQLVVEAKEPARARITKLTGDGLDILGVESQDSDFATTASPIKPGVEYDLNVRYVGKPGRGLVRSQVTVKTNEPGQADIAVPLIGNF